MSFRAVLSAAAIALTLIAFYPYIRDTLRGSVKPHVFSWIIWGKTTFVVFLAQLEADGGVGAWAIGVSGSISIFIALLAFLKRADITITRVDWCFLLLAFSSLPLWYLTDDPLWAVVVLTTVDLLGFGPTLRKAYANPHTESLPFFAILLVRNLLVVLALESYSTTTWLFPAAIGLASGLLAAVIVFRRRVIGLPIGARA